MQEKLSLVIPAYNEEKNIAQCIHELRATLRDKHHIPYELIVVDDNSRDRTAEVVEQEMAAARDLRLVRRCPPGGFGRAIRSGLDAVRGDVVVVYMADLSDDPEDVVAYYRKIQEGYDCVFGSRFIKGAEVKNYPPVKLLVNRLVNHCVQLMFWTGFNDLTNAFKAYRVEVLRDCGPYRASHFNLTLEMSLGALIRGYHIAQVPIRWQGRTSGVSNLNLRTMGRRYLSTLLMMFFQRYLIVDDLIAERFASNRAHHGCIQEIECRLERLEAVVNASAAESIGDMQGTPDQFCSPSGRAEIG